MLKSLNFLYTYPPIHVFTRRDTGEPRACNQN